jgi:hypothetical protein
MTELLERLALGYEIVEKEKTLAGVMLWWKWWSVTYDGRFHR